MVVETRQFESRDAIRFTVTFTNVSGALTDPTTVTGGWENGQNVVTPLTPVKLSLGVWYEDLLIPSVTEKTTMKINMTGVGAVARSLTVAFEVIYTPFS